VHGTKNAEVSDTDTSAFGRIDKVSRIAGSINFNLYKKTKKINGKPKVVFCTSLPHELLYTTFERIQMFASRQSLQRYTYGTRRINLKKYDFPVKSFINTVEVSFESSLNIDGIPDECFLPCHRVIMAKENPTHDERVALVTDLSHTLRMGGILPKDEKVITLLRNMVKQCNWFDYDDVETEDQVRYTVNKMDKYYSCHSRKMMGVCTSKCPGFVG
jgi:hypothetical protein